jgi:hypothetical protein
MSALSGGVAPAFAKPGHDDPGIPIYPTEVMGPPAQQQAPEQAPEPPPAPKQDFAPPKQVEAPPQQVPIPEVQAPAPAPEPVPAPAPAPVVQAPAPPPPAPEVQAPPPPKKETPRVADVPKVDTQKIDPPKVDPPKADVPKADVPKIDPPKVDVPKSDVPQVDAPKSSPSLADVPKTGAAPVDPPKGEAPKQDAPNVDVPQVDPPKVDGSLPLPGVDQSGKPADPKLDPAGPRNLAPGQSPDTAAGTNPDKQQPDKQRQDGPSSINKAAQRITTETPDTMQAADQDIQVARQSKPVELKPEPAAKHDVDLLSSAIDINSRTKLGPFESEFHVGSDFSVGANRDRDRDRDHDRDHDRDWDWNNKQWDHKVRQWDRRWIDYDDYYRPVFCNPYRAPVRIVYLYERTPRILIIPPLGRAVVDAAALAAYSFTAVVLNAANLAADVAVGTFFGGGYIPPIGAPFIPPPPLTRYDNVPVQVRYSNATYQPFRVNQIVDVGDDVQYGGRKVLLDGATPAWGQWTTSPSGERQFEVHRTQQYPGLGDPQEAPLPGDYQMRLASDESANTDTAQMFLMGAAGVVAGLGFGALGLALYLGRRRRTL